VETRLLNVLTAIPAALLDGRPSRRQRALLWGTALVLAVVGAMAWLSFFEGGRFSFAQHDWPKERDGFAVLAQAVKQGVVPLYSTVAHQGTVRFLANPEIPWTPDILLLRWLDIGSFVVVHVLLFFLIGLAGCLALGLRLGLSPVALAALVLLTCFNGHVVSHLAVGHSMWVGAFLLPWFLLAVRAWAVDAPSRGSILGLVCILWLLLLTGAFHIALMAGLYLGILALLSPAYRPHVLRILALAGLLGAVRIIPALTTMGTGPRANGFGYPNLWTLLEGLVVARPLEAATFGHPSAGWWEFDAYIGLEGLAILILFGLLAARSVADGLFRRIMVSAGVLAILSLGDLFFVVHALHIPVLDAERVVTRFVLLPLLFLIMESCLHFQRLIERRRPPCLGISLLSLVGVCQLASALLGHLEARGMGPTGQVPALAPLHQAPAAIDVSHVVEPVYLGSLLVGLVVSVVGCGVMGGWLRWSRRKTVGADE
jgi:hypothetical protein